MYRRVFGDSVLEVMRMMMMMVMIVVFVVVARTTRNAMPETAREWGSSDLQSQNWQGRPEASESDTHISGHFGLEV